MGLPEPSFGRIHHLREVPQVIPLVRYLDHVGKNSFRAILFEIG